MIKSYNDITGWFDWAPLYDDMVEKAENDDVIIEVGCFLGKSMAYLGQRVNESGKKIHLVAVDIFEPECEHHADVLGGRDMLTEFKSNMTDLRINVHAIKGKSPEVMLSGNAIVRDDAIFGVFVDAAHDYISVVEDLGFWWPKIRPGGIFAGHDYFEQTAGVKQAVDEFVSREKLELHLRDHCWLIYKHS
jgi:hypothetical protein